MLAIDVLSSYVICGAGSLVGAGMLRMADCPEPRVAAALRIFVWALTVLGISLVSLVVQGQVPSAFALTVSSSGALVCMVLWGWGVSLLAGDEPPGALMWFCLALAALTPPLGTALGPHGLARALALGLLVTSVFVACAARRFVIAPPDAASRVLGGVVLLLTLSGLLRVGWTFAYEGEPLPHLMHVPESVMPVFAVLYGVLPIVVSTMLLNVVNAQLRGQLIARASTDELTGLNTRRALRDGAQGQFGIARCAKLETAVLMMDLDHFKAINDRFGHAAGDLVLRHVGVLWRENLRTDSLLARYGGEEFVALVPVQDLRTARLVANRLREVVATAAWHVIVETPLSVTTSVGVTLLVGGESLDDALRRADAALYRAKREGRDQVQVGLAAA